MLSPFLAPYVTSLEERFSQGNKAERKETILWFRLFTLRRLRTDGARAICTESGERGSEIQMQFLCALDMSVHYLEVFWFVRSPLCSLCTFIFSHIMKVSFVVEQFLFPF